MAEETKATVETVSEATQTQEAAAAKETDGGLLAKVKELLGLGKDETKDPESSKTTEKAMSTSETKADDPKTSEKQDAGKYSQEDLKAAVKKAQDELLAQQEEKMRKAKLTPEEKAAEEKAQMKAQNEELAGKLKRMELEQKAAKALAEKKLPTGLSEFLDYSDENKMTASLEKLGKMYQADLEAGISERLKGSTPKGLGSAGNLTDNLVSSEIAKRIRGGL